MKIMISAVALFFGLAMVAVEADAAKRLALPSRLNLGLAQRHVCPLPRPEIEAGARLRNLLGP